MFKPQVRQEIERRLSEFIQVEMNNRLTPNNWNYLMMTLGPIFEKNKIVPEPEKEKEPIAEIHNIEDKKGEKK